jgi:hypothetical protein
MLKQLRQGKCPITSASATPCASFLMMERLTDRWTILLDFIGDLGYR